MTADTVLVVEDEPRLCAFIAGALREEGYTVLDASNGEDAVRIVRGHAGPIHLLLTDVIMQGMNGRELSKIVREIRQNVPVLFMSGSPDDALLRDGIEAASARLLLKPFSLEALTVAIRDALQRSTG
jgi:two-component system, cell cycle sensor histidine kinase and response regulator CckA